MAGGTVDDQYNDQLDYIIADLPERRVLDILKLESLPVSAYQAH